MSETQHATIMKKALFLFSIIMFSLSTLNAQKSDFFCMGIKGGVNLSQLKTGDFLAVRFDGSGKAINYNGQTLKDNLNQSLDTRTGYVGGIYARFGRKIFIQPEVIFSAKGGSLNILQGGANSTSQIVDVEYTSFDVPLMIGLKLGPLHLNGGPVASFNVSSNQKLNDALKNYTANGLDNAFKKAAYGYQVGGGLDIFRLSLDVRYEGSLSEVSLAPLKDSNLSFSQKSQLWQVTLGYRIF